MDDNVQTEKQPAAWHTLTVQETIAHLGVDAAAGLSDTEAAQRLARFGPNQLSVEKRETIWEELLEELREPMVLLLLVTGVLYAVWGKLEDAITIFAVILTLAGVELFNERRAQKAIAALRKLAEPTALVRRGGRRLEAPVETLVPGDVLALEAGRRLPADARLLEAYGLALDESALTGESVPVDKEATPTLPADAALAERRNLLFAGTTIVRGRGTAVVVATGQQTELGHIAGMARQVKPPKTPLQKAMSELSQSLVGLALGFSVVVPVLGVLLAHQPLQSMLLTGLSLAFATIPEEMPIIITMVLALGGYRLSRQHAIVKRLQAVETLGAITVIATDKTGTLTENRMQVSRLEPKTMNQRLLELGILCNDAMEDRGEGAGDPLETALLRAAREAGLDVQALRADAPLRNEFTFDNVRKRMSVVVSCKGQFLVAVKGAPESVLACCARLTSNGREQDLAATDRQTWLDQATQMAGEGLRVIALAEKHVPVEPRTQEEAESGLAFVGLVGLADPPRPEVAHSIATLRGAGIRTVMVTGDHPLTAGAIAAKVGLDGTGCVVTGPELDGLSDEALQELAGQVSLYARTTPEHKLRIVRALRARGERVAVTGDGINDAPALSAADIGIAMGETGTDVAREAGDMVLADDNFATIARAVGEGRLLFANLSKGVRYYLACKVALVLATLLPVLLRVPVPFAPVQIILMELFMDLAAAATFVAEPAESDLMRQKPRDPQAKFMDRPMIASILTSAVGLFAAVSAVYLPTWYSGAGQPTAQTAAFTAWLLGHVLLAFNMRSDRQPIFQLGLFSNRGMIAWGLSALAFVLTATLVTPLHALLKTTSLSGQQWALILGAVLVGTGWIEVRKLITYKVKA